MFRTNIRAMDAAEQELQRQIRKLNQAIDETERVISGLSGLSGMGQVRYSLRNQVARLERERKNMRDMLAALNQIERCYVNCENRIIDYAEDTRRRNRVSFEWFHIQPNANIAQIAAQIRY